MSNQLAEALRLAREWFRHEEAGEGPQAPEVIAALDAALAAHEAAKPAEPFGYVSEHNCEGPHQFQFHNSLSSIYWDNCKNFTAVYAAPVAVASPLTADQIEAMPVWKHFIGLMPEHRLEFTRAIESHHGIKEQA